MQVDISRWEMHNVVRDGSGDLRTRRGFAATMDFASDDIIASFSVENPKTTEMWWYVFVWAATGVTLRVYDEGRQFASAPLFSLPLGVMSRDIVITMATSYGYLMFNSPAFSVPLFGFVGGGVCAMLAVPSENPDSTTLEVPRGHCCTFGDRWAVAQDNAVYFPDAGIEGVRSFTANNVLVVPGNILDMFQAGGSLYIFTTIGCYTLGADALSVGQDVVGFLGQVDGVSTTASRNAVATPFGVVVLGKSDISVISGGGGVQKLAIPRYTGRRQLSRAVEVDDYRTFGRLFAAADGFLLGFGRQRDMFLSADMRTGTYSWMYGSDSQNQPTALHGVLYSRDGDQFLCFQHTVVQAITVGNSDNFMGEMLGYVCGVLPIDTTDQPLFRRVTVAVANAGGTAGVALAPAKNVVQLTPTHSGDVVIGSSTWAADEKINSYDMRTTRCTVNVRCGEPHIELVFGGCGRRIASTINLEMSGTWRARKDRQP